MKKIFLKLWFLIAMLVLSMLTLRSVSLASCEIDLGSVKPGDIVVKKIKIMYFEEIYTKVNVLPRTETDFYLRGKNGVKIPAIYRCEIVSYNKDENTVTVKVSVKVKGEIKWEYAAGKYTGEITITLVKI